MIPWKILTKICWVSELKKEIWYLRTRMKANAKDIVIQSYNLVISDEMLEQWRTENSGVSMSDKKLRTKLLKDRIVGLIGDAETKDSFFIYGRGTVGHTTGIISFPTDSFHVKRTEPKGAFEHRAIKEVVIKTIFTASRGMDCLADAFEDGDTHIFNPVPLETIALAATAVLFL